MNCCATLKVSGALPVGYLGTGDGGLIAGGLEAALPLAAAFEKVSDTDIELLSHVQIID